MDKFGGCLDELSYGLYVASFNAPMKIENPAQAAALCALQAQAALAVLRTQHKMQKRVDLPFALGLAWGESQVGLAEARSAASAIPFWEARPWRPGSWPPLRAFGSAPA